LPIRSTISTNTCKYLPAVVDKFEKPQVWETLLKKNISLTPENKQAANVQNSLISYKEANKTTAICLQFPPLT